MALDLSIATRVYGALTGSADMATPTAAFDTATTKTLTSGVGANQADYYWSDERTVTTGATDSIDVAGALSGLLGGTVTFARIKGIRVRNSQASGVANTTNLTIARPAANGVPIFDAASDSVTIAPDGEVLLMRPDATGWAVTAGTGDLISIVNAAGASNVYRIEIWGGLS